MPRVSLGVILAGDPEYVQKPNIFVKTLGGICNTDLFPVALVLSHLLL